VAKTFSVEDGNLSSAVISSTRLKVYSDIDLTFSVKPSGEIYKKTGSAAVKQSVMNLILTNFGEKPFNPEFGANLRALLFELADEDAEEDIERQILSAIESYEPRAEALHVQATAAPDRNEITVNVTFRVVATSEEVTLTKTLTRLR